MISHGSHPSSLRQQTILASFVTEIIPDSLTAVRIAEVPRSMSIENDSDFPTIHTTNLCNHFSTVNAANSLVITVFPRENS